MKNNQFRLEEKTAIITGPLTQLHVSICQALTENGCSVGLIHSQVNEAERFCEQLNGQLEINPKYGRVCAFAADLRQTTGMRDALNRVAESFGSIDIYIDGWMLHQSCEFADEGTLENLDQMVEANLKSPIRLSHAVVNILKERRRGRIIYLLGDVQRLGGQREALNAVTRNGLIGLSQSLSRQFSSDTLTVNCVALGPTEEYLQQAYDQCKTVSTAEAELKKEFPQLKSIDVQSTAELICFLASPLSSTLTGQVVSASQGLNVN